MKKLLVLVSVVCLLAFAGSAFADDYSYESIDSLVESYEGSDIAGHVDATFGDGAYSRYLAEKAATEPSEETVAKFDSTMNIISGDEVSVTSDPSGASTTIVESFGDGSQTVVNLPTYTVDSTKVTEGQYYDLLIVESMTATQATALNGAKLVLLADKTDKDSALGTLSLKQGRGGVTTTHANGANIAAGTFAAGDALALHFKYSATGDYAPVAASDALPFAPGFIAGASVPGALGGSGGGCAMGTSAIALAVLGLFIAKRRG